MKAFAVVISGLLLVSPAVASDTNTNTNQTQAPAAEANGDAGTGTQTAEDQDPNRRICRRIETNTGSRVPFRTVCLTARQWSERDHQY